MGTGSGAMAGSAVLFLVLCSLPYMHAQCCTKKIVTGAAAEDKGLVGTYTLLNDVSDDKNVACFDGCVYAREGRQGEEYCFQAVAGGADIEDQCDAPTGKTAEAGAQTTAGAGAQTSAGAGAQTTAAAGAQTTPLSSDELRQQAEEAAAEVTVNNAIIVEDNERIEKAEATTSAIDAIQSKLTPDEATTPTGRIRQKRQATTNAPTPKAVDEPGTCEEFGTTYKVLLNMAADVTDENIAQIKVYVDALINVDVAGLCNLDALITPASQTSSQAEAAVKSTKDYTGAKETKVKALKKEVNEDIELQSTINDELVEREEATVPIGAQTYAVDATTPSGSGGEQTPVDMDTPKGTTPVEGETPEGTPPAEAGTPEGTPPAEGETPEGTTPAEGTPPAEAGTPEGTLPAEGETPEGTPPAEGETPEGTPPAEAGTPEGTPPAEGETPEGTPPAEGETP